MESGRRSLSRDLNKPVGLRRCPKPSQTRRSTAAQPGKLPGCPSNIYGEGNKGALGSLKMMIGKENCAAQGETQRCASGTAQPSSLPGQLAATISSPKAWALAPFFTMRIRAMPGSGICPRVRIRISPAWSLWIQRKRQEIQAGKRLDHGATKHGTVVLKDHLKTTQIPALGAANPS
ncbi:hypothetical protein SVAN01_10708 [Stagonosporopsis vannaccii]|nr:hypothetical protein SVAN01_10708 [Stagonosporopsis vannaccii]